MPLKSVQRKFGLFFPNFLPNIRQRLVMTPAAVSIMTGFPEESR